MHMTVELDDDGTDATFWYSIEQEGDEPEFYSDRDGLQYDCGCVDITHVYVSEIETDEVDEEDLDALKDKFESRMLSEYGEVDIEYR